MTSPCRCQGGFCELALPPVNNEQQRGDKSTLSKRERRLQKSRERDRATRLLKWVLTEEEYSALEETGDLVRLKVKPRGGKKNCNDDDDGDCGLWMDGKAVNLAKREHRPDLARLAFAEFQSSGESSGEGDRPGTAVGCSNQVSEPLQPGNGGDVVVCGVCFNVYTLLAQARDLLAAQRDEAAMATDDAQEDASDNQLAGDHQPADDSLGNMEEIPHNNLKRASSEGPNSSEWDAAKKPPILSAASFHGPISPQHKRNDSDNNNTKSKARARRKKRDRKQMEENANIHILIAESDEVHVCCFKEVHFVAYY